ncbi:MAG TPA: hypothetical protein VFV30_00155 [Novosphingobium sp.]|nr:hypothetical protein [Novosphingobium sp.]
MRLLLIAGAAALAMPTLAVAEEAPKTEEAAKPAKVRKLCRETQPRTGSHRPGKRVCRTAEEWKAFDQAEAGYDGQTTTRSTGVTESKD